VSERVVALSTVGTAEDAERIARALVERRLAACVNVVPKVVSVYRWKGEVSRDEELMLVIKTRRERLEALREALVGMHPYEVPELVALPIEGGLEAYLAWVDDSVSGSSGSRSAGGPSGVTTPPAPGPGRPRGRTRPRSRR
jgi:periplasmic divalent cation tolerance protein